MKLEDGHGNAVFMYAQNQAQKVERYLLLNVTTSRKKHYMLIFFVISMCFQVSYFANFAAGLRLATAAGKGDLEG